MEAATEKAPSLLTWDRVKRLFVGLALVGGGVGCTVLTLKLSVMALSGSPGAVLALFVTCYVGFSISVESFARLAVRTCRKVTGSDQEKAS